MKTYKTVLYSAIGALVLFSCGGKEEGESMETPIADGLIVVTKAQFASGEMKIGTLTEQTISTKILTRGYIDVPPGNKVSVTPFHGGYVKDLDILPGQKVKKGELLFTLQNPEIIEMQQEYLETKEKLVYLKADFDRQKTLSEEKISSQKNYKKAESEYKVMLAKNNGLQQQLKLVNVSIGELDKGVIKSTLPVYASLGGTITAVNTTKGAYINPGASAAEITNTDHLHLELQVFEKDALMISEEQLITFRVPESGDETFEGSVHLVGKSIDGGDRTINVHGHVPEDDEGRFIPGMFVEAEIETNSGRGLCLPESALMEVDEVFYVLAKTGEKEGDLFFEQQMVSTGKKSGDWVEILNPKTLSGKQVLLDGGFSLVGE